LVIQGSASIYSKKVEYLHKMCHQALDFIADNNRKEAGAGDDGVEHEAEHSLDDDIDAFLRFGDDIDGASFVCAGGGGSRALAACHRTRRGIEREGGMGPQRVRRGDGFGRGCRGQKHQPGHGELQDGEACAATTRGALGGGRRVRKRRQ
jgi:hypothetical protein